MKYFKLIREGEIVDALCDEEASWMVENPRSLSVYVGSMESAKGVLSSDGATVWHIEGKEKFHDYPDYPTVAMEEIGPGEYQWLLDELQVGRTITTEPEENLPVDATPADDTPFSTELEYLKQLKTSELNKTCKEVIVAGFFCTLSDGVQHHFGWTLEDQANFTSRMIQLMSGMVQACDYYDYDGRCLSLTAEDMQMIASVADVHASYYRAYFHCLVMLVSDLEDAESVWGVEWGIPVPHKYQSEAFQKYASLIGGGVYEPSEAD